MGESINKTRFAANLTFLKLSDGSLTRAYYIILFTLIQFDVFHSKKVKNKKIFDFSRR